MIKNLSTEGKTTLLARFNGLWPNRTFPLGWKHSLTVPVAKAGQNNMEPKGYRPISLTSCVSKIMERMVNNRLVDTLTEHNKLFHRQFAFRLGRGTNAYFASLGQVAKSRNQHFPHKPIFRSHHWKPQIADIS